MYVCFCGMFWRIVTPLLMDRWEWVWNHIAEWMGLWYCVKTVGDAFRIGNNLHLNYLDWWIQGLVQQSVRWQITYCKHRNSNNVRTNQSRVKHVSKAYFNTTLCKQNIWLERNVSNYNYVGELCVSTSILSDRVPIARGPNTFTCMCF